MAHDWEIIAVTEDAVSRLVTYRLYREKVVIKETRETWRDGILVDTTESTKDGGYQFEQHSVRVAMDKTREEVEAEVEADAARRISETTTPSPFEDIIGRKGKP